MPDKVFNLWREAGVASQEPVERVQETFKILFYLAKFTL